jgi:uncharacterized RDD family membrane protein YckC
VIHGLPLEVRAAQGRGAGLVSRTAADLIDVLAAAAFLLVGSLAVGATAFVLRPQTFRWPTFEAPALATVAGVVLIAYLATAWATTGRSIGKQVMGLRVVRQDGSTIRTARATVRAALCVVFPIGLLWCLVDRRGRSVHDLLLGTSVIYDWRRGGLDVIAGSSLVPVGTDDVVPADARPDADARTGA